jgi:hypothetical protein
MNSSDFFREEKIADWTLQGLDPWKRFRSTLDADLMDRLRRSPVAQFDEIDTAYALAQLARDEFLACGTDGKQRLDDGEIVLVLRALRATLKRVDIDFDLPFRDFKGFHGYWSAEGMGGSWAARRAYLAKTFDPVFLELDGQDEKRLELASVKGVDGLPKNIIFASTGPKPTIVLRDAINNVVEVTRNGEYCLFYDRPIEYAGLSWGQLVRWWKDASPIEQSKTDAQRNLYLRLSASVASNPLELSVFRTYCKRYGRIDADDIPAILPQVYLHFDPLTRAQRKGVSSVLVRERMDFLLLFSGRSRVVIEVDGIQHYATGNTASPRLYAEMVAEDRRLRLRGYEVYRFGGAELSRRGALDVLDKFFDDLLERHAT